MTIPFNGKTLGEQFRQRRLSLGLNIDQAADGAGISRMTLYRIEKGDENTSLASCLHLARALGLGLSAEPVQQPVRPVFGQDDHLFDEEDVTPKRGPSLPRGLGP